MHQGSTHFMKIRLLNCCWGLAYRGLGGWVPRAGAEQVSLLPRFPPGLVFTGTGAEQSSWGVPEGKLTWSRRGFGTEKHSYLFKKGSPSG